MATGIRIEQALLWLFVILAGVVVGVGLYEMRVIVPLWAHSPPESVWYWEAQRAAHPEYVPNSGLRLWVFLTPSHVLVSLATLLACLKTRGAHRKWVLISTVVFLLMHTTAFAWFVPTLNALAKPHELGLGPEDVATKARLWATLSWLRVPAGLFGFVAGLRALQIPPSRD